MEKGEDRAWLGPWILGPVILLVAMIFATFLLPSVDCGFSDQGDAGRILFAVIAGLSSLLVGAAAVYRLAAMWRRGSFTGRDGFLAGVALLVVCVAAAMRDGNSEDNLAGALGGGFLLMVVCFVALLVAAAADKGPDDVGALVPIYLVGAALTYPLVAWFVLEINAGAFC